MIFKKYRVGLKQNINWFLVECTVCDSLLYICLTMWSFMLPKSLYFLFYRKKKTLIILIKFQQKIVLPF